MRIALAAAMTLLAASAAHAEWTPSGAVLAKLAKGDVHADVSPAGDGASGVVHAAVDIEAPPEIVWITILDCNRAGRMAPGVQSCRVVEKDPGGRWDVREMIVRWAPLAPTFRTLFRSDFVPPDRIRFHCTGGDIRVCQGEWRLQDIGEGRTRVLYENRATSPIAAPAMISRAAMRANVLSALKALKRESESRTR
jgi:carbon monoxide dehydrogenase subunit G